MKKEWTEKDRRVVPVSLTSKGYTTIEELELMDKYFYELEAEDIQRLMRIFTTLIDICKEKGERMREWSIYHQRRNGRS